MSKKSCVVEKNNVYVNENFANKEGTLMETKKTITLYHGTAAKNISNIAREGIKPSGDHVYFYETENDCLLYLFNTSLNDVAVIPIEFSQEEYECMEKDLDNDPTEMPTSYAYMGIIEKTRLPHSLNDIHRYEFY